MATAIPMVRMRAEAHAIGVPENQPLYPRLAQAGPRPRAGPLAKGAKLQAYPFNEGDETEGASSLRGGLAEQAVTARWWVFGVSLLMVISAIIVVTVLEIVSPPYKAGPVNVVISSNLPFLGFQFSSYPIDITYSTFLLVLGVVAGIVSITDYAPYAIADAFGRTNDHWMGMLFGAFAFGSITYLTAQICAITDAFTIILISVLAMAVPICNYFQGLVNDMTAPQLFFQSLNGGSDEALGFGTATSELPGTKFQPHFFAWFFLITVLCTILAYGISSAQVQSPIETAACAGGAVCDTRMWFTITVFVIYFVFTVLITVLDGLRYWYDRSNQGGAVRWMRRADNSTGIMMVLYGILLIVPEWLLMGVAFTTRYV